MQNHRLTFVALFLTLATPLLGAEHWNQFRGPKGDGKATSELLPVQFNETTNIRWKTAIHGKAWSSPVVWGKERMVMRDDYVMLSQTYFDQDMQPVKGMETTEVGEIGGRVIPIRMRMSSYEEPEKWTEISYDVADFDANVDDQKFTMFSLQSGR